MKSGHRQPRSRRIIALSNVVAVLLTSTLVAARAGAQEFEHRAFTERPALEVGEVATGAEIWLCKGDYCATRTRSQTLPMGACGKLAARVGRIRSFGPAAGKPLSTADLADCNATARLNVTGKVGGEIPPGGGGRLPPIGTPLPNLPDRTLYYGDRLIVDFAGSPVVLDTGNTWPLSWFCFERTCISNLVDRMPSVAECRDLNLKTRFRVTAVTSPRGRYTPDEIRLCNRPEVVALEFVVTTGRDGIRRSDSDAAGVQFQTATRRDSVGSGYVSRFYFDEGLTERTTVSRTLPTGEYHSPHALALGDLRSITLSFRSGSTGAAFEQGDEWELAALTIRAHMQEMDGTRYVRDIYRREGSPLHRFSSGDRWEITFSESVLGY